MPSITINGVKTDFSPGQTILQVANSLQEQGKGVEIPQYCYHDGLSIVASCRICLAECWAPNPKTGAIEPMMGGKLLPTCQTPASDGMVVYSDSPKALANQKAVMEYLLINHPLDCPVCDQAGECFLQDYSYQYGRGVSRFEEQKVKQPKKDLGPHVYLYSDRCIMCTRCVRFTREVSGTSELMVQGRGNKEEIDVFPGVPIDNELSGNVIDLCPVGALLDKDFLFAQRVWFLKETPSIDPLTSSGDNITVHHNEGAIYRVKPRRNLAVNKWWISDEVRYGWKFVHSENRLTQPLRKQYGTLVPTDHARAYGDILEAARKAVDSGKRVALMVSPTLACEEAFTLARAVRQLDPKAHLSLGPVPVRGSDKSYPVGAAETDPRAFRVCAEKCPNSRGVRRVLQAFAEPSHVASYDLFLDLLGRGTGASQVGVVILTGNFPSEWVTDELLNALSGKLVIAIDTLAGRILEKADIVLPGATFAEKAGTFENHKNMIQAFEQAFAPKELARSEGQIGLDLSAAASGSLSSAPVYNAANVRRDMAAFSPALGVFQTQVHLPTLSVAQEPDMEVVEL